MPNREKHAVDRFSITDGDGEECEAVVYHTMVEHKFRDKPSEWVIVEKEIRLTDGRPITPLDESLTTFKIFGTGPILKRLD